MYFLLPIKAVVIISSMPFQEYVISNSNQYLKAHKLRCLLGEERYVFVHGVVGNVSVGGVVVGDENIEENLLK